MALNKPRRPTLFKPVAGKSPTTSETSAVAGPVGAGSSDVETKEGGMAADASHGISRPEATAKATSVSGSSERAAMQPRTEYLPDRSGEVLLHAVFPKLLRRGEPFRIAIPMLDCIPKLKVPFIYAFLQRCRGTDSLDSIEAYARTLQNGFIEFLCENDLNKISLSDIDDALAAKFVEWLNRTEDGKAVMAIATRSNALILLRKMMVILAESETWGSQVGAMTVLRMVHWPGRATAGTPIEALDVDHMAAIWRACVAEIAETVDQFESSMQLIESALPTLRALDAYSDSEIRNMSLGEIRAHLHLAVKSGVRLLAELTHSV